jgi:hypothetical protein
MRPRRFWSANLPIELPGGNEDNTLWAEHIPADETDLGAPVFRTVWEPTDEERAFIAAGGNIELLVWGHQHYPVAVMVTDEPLGKLPTGEAQPSPE